MTDKDNFQIFRRNLKSLISGATQWKSGLYQHAIIIQDKAENTIK